MKTLHTIYNNFAKRNLARLLTIFIILFTLSIVQANATKVTDKVYTFGSSSTPAGWSVGSSNTHESGFLKLSANDYLEMTVEDIFAEGEILSSNTIKVEVSCGTYGTWSSPKSVLCSVELRTSNGEVLTTNNATFSNLNNSQTTYRTAIEVNKPNDPAKIAYLRITFSNFNSTDSGTLRVKYVKLNYETSTPTPSGYAVTYNNGGRGTAPLNTTASSVTLSAITATGYTNTGWTADVAVKNGSTTISTGELIENGTTVTLTQATTFTAQWQINSYKVTWKPNGGNWSGNASDKVEDYNYGATITTPTNPTRYGYNFTGWNPTPATTMPASDQTYTAQWTEKSLTNYRTTCSKEPSYSVNSTLSHVTADGGNPTNITSEDTELELSYSADTDWNLPENITITMGGNELTDSEYVWDNENGDLFIQPTSGFTGIIVVTINGWQQLDAPTGLNVENITSSGATLSWDEVANASSYTVQVYGENDEIIAEYTGLTENTKTVSELDPKTNYVFGVVAVGDGITYTNSIQAVSDVFTTSSATCTVTYNANGGIGTPPSDETEYTNGATVTVQGNFGKLTKDGYAFTGWNTEADGSGDSYKHNDQFAITANTTLYAQWCEAYWKLVTDESELKNDTRIVIAAKDYNFALSTTQNDANRGQATIEKKYNTISQFDGSTQILSLVDVTNNSFALYTGTQGYLYAASSSANQLKTKEEFDLNGDSDWSIAIYQGVATILAQGDNSHNQIKYNHQQSGQLFSCYESSNTTMSAVAIYKEVCVQDQYNVTSNLTNSTANTNPTTVASNATSLTLNYSANTGYLLPETITVKMGGALLVATTNYTWDKATGTLTINVTGFYGDIDVKIVAEVDPCYGFAMSEVTATSTTNSVTLSWSNVEGATSYNITLNPGDFSVSTGNISHTFEGLSPKTTYTWEVQAVKGTCQASQTGSIATQKESFTVSWVVNGKTTTTEPVVDGESITQYPSPSAPSGCQEKVFVGWTDNPINTPTDEAPAILYKQKSDVPAITGNTTLHAVWATEEGGGNGNYIKVTSEPTDWSGDYLIVANGNCFDGSRTTTIDANGNYQAVTISNNEIASSNTTDSYIVSISKSTNIGKYYIKTKSGYYIGSTATNDNELLNSTTTKYDNTISISGNDVTIKGTNSIFRFYVQSGQTPRFRYYKGLTNTTLPQLYKKSGGTTYSAYTTLCDECTPSTLTLEADKTTADLDINGEATITFSTTGGNNGAITYVANPKTGVTWDNGTATFTKAGEYSITASQGKNGENCPTTSNTVNVTITAIPHLYFVTEPADPIVFDPVECGGNTRVEDKKSVELQGYNLTGNVTVNVTGAYKIARTSSATLGEYSNSLTLDKNKTDGKINGNYDIVYILSFPPAGGTASTVGELTFTTEAGNTLTVNLSTPTVTCTPRTLTFNDRGNTTTQEYYAGAEVPQPEDPTGVCTIPVNYVFDGWAEAEVTDGSTSYTKVNFPYSMPAQNTTLYAVYRYAAGETTPTDDFVSCDINSDGIKSGGEFIITANKNNSYDEYAFNSTINSDGKGSTTPLELTPIDENGDEEDDYYQITTTNNGIIWILEGDIENGYTVKNKQTGTYWNVNNGNLQLGNTSTEKFTFYHPASNSWPIYIYNATSSKYVAAYGTSPVQYNLYNSNTHDIYLYSRKLITSYLYTTSPDCGGIAITYDFAGGDGGHCTDTRVEGGSDYTICEDVPTKTGYTFLHWSDGVNTYNPSDVIENVTADITLTAQWQINTYTVIWSNNGATTPVTYEHGDDLTLPSEPASCDGVKEFVGWTEQSGYYHATTPPSDLFTEKTATVTADATYYAVFATKGEGSANFVLGESGTFKMYANVNGTNYYAQGGVSSSKITSTTEAANASDYTLTYADGVYSIKQGTSNVGNKADDANLNTNETTWTISEGTNGSWRVTSNVSTSRALSYSTSASAFKAYSISNITGSPTIYYDIEFGGTSSGYSDYTTICQQIESIEVQEPQTEFYITDNFTIGTGKVIATLSGGETTDVTALATFSGYNMNAVGTYTVTVTYMGATATYEINVKPLDNAWVLTWNVSGKTNTGLSPRSVTKGNAIGTLPVPEVPAACEGKTFMGWTESNIVPSDGKGIVYITEATKPSANTTYYAVFATVNNFCKQMPIEDIKSNSKVVVVAVASLTADGGSGKAISSRTISITSQGVIGLSGDEVSISDETINTPHSTCIWTLTKEGGGIVLEQDGKYIRAVNDGYRKLLLETTKDYWTLTPVEGKYQTYYMQSGNTEHYLEWFDHTDDKYDEGEKYIGFVPFIQANDYGDFDMQFYVTLGDNADITDYTTGCEEYTITYYGFRGGYSTSTSSDGIIVLPVNSSHTVPDCGDVVTDHTNLGREFLNVWMTQPHGGHTFKPGDTFILTQDTTLYAQWKLETTSDVTTLPTDIEDMAGTDVYVYGGTALNIQPGSTTINSLTLKGGIQSDGSYKMPTVWVPEGATLIRNSNKIYLDLAINAKNYYPFAVPFATKNDQYIDYLDPVLREASIYGTHFVIKTYDGAQRAKIGEDRDNNWVRVLRHTGGTTSYLEPGVGYIITALTYPDEDTATIRIPMTVPNTWFENGEQTVVGTTTRNTVSVVGHTGEAATEHRRHAGWNFVASPYLSNFSGNNIGGEQGYINGWIDVTNGLFPYYDTEVPYVTVPVADFAYYKQTKVAEATLSPEWSFFVQIAADAGGTMNFAIEGRKQAPASVAARYAEERPVKMDVDITLTNGSESDQTGLIICDHYTHEYEIGRDLEKMFGSAYNLVVYSIMQDKTPLAYQALPIQHDMQVIPIGYRAPAKGEYTFSLNATSSIELLSEKYEQLILEDYETGARTNLLEANYTFDSERTQSDTRFVIYPVLRKNTPTDVPNILDNSQTTHKVFHNGHLYIIHEGRVYNGNGQIVK